MAYTVEARRNMPRELSNPLRCEHLYRILSALEQPLSLSELWEKARVSAGIYYSTIEKNLLQLGLVEYEERGRSIVVRLTEKGRKLLEVMKEIGFEKITEIR